MGYPAMCISNDVQRTTAAQRIVVLGLIVMSTGCSTFKADRETAEKLSSRAQSLLSQSNYATAATEFNQAAQALRRDPTDGIYLKEDYFLEAAALTMRAADQHVGAALRAMAESRSEDMKTQALLAQQAYHRAAQNLNVDSAAALSAKKTDETLRVVGNTVLATLSLVAGAYGTRKTGDRTHIDNMARQVDAMSERDAFKVRPVEVQRLNLGKADPQFSDVRIGTAHNFSGPFSGLVRVAFGRHPTEGFLLGCTGAALHPQIVLTALHCLYDADGRKRSVTVVRDNAFGEVSTYVRSIVTAAGIDAALSPERAQHLSATEDWALLVTDEVATPPTNPRSTKSAVKDKSKVLPLWGWNIPDFEGRTGAVIGYGWDVNDAKYASVAMGCPFQGAVSLYRGQDKFKNYLESEYARSAWVNNSTRSDGSPARYMAMHCSTAQGHSGSPVLTWHPRLGPIVIGLLSGGGVDADLSVSRSTLRRDFVVPASKFIGAYQKLRKDLRL